MLLASHPLNIKAHLCFLIEENVSSGEEKENEQRRITAEV